MSEKAEKKKPLLCDDGKKKRYYHTYGGNPAKCVHCGKVKEYGVLPITPPPPPAPPAEATPPASTGLEALSKAIPSPNAPKPESPPAEAKPEPAKVESPPAALPTPPKTEEEKKREAEEAEKTRIRLRKLHKIAAKWAFKLEEALDDRLIGWIKNRHPDDVAPADDDEKDLIMEGWEELSKLAFGEKELTPWGKVGLGTFFMTAGKFASTKAQKRIPAGPPPPQREAVPPPKPAPDESSKVK